MTPSTEGERLDDGQTLAIRYRRRLVVFALRRLGDREDAEDAAQETLRRVLEALTERRLRDPGALPGFVFQTARHVCQQLLRKRGRNQDALERLSRSTPETWDSLLEELVDEDRRRVVRRALDDLEPDDRNLLQLFYGHGLSTEDVGLRLGISAGAARVRKHRALKRLAARLGDGETYPPDRKPN